MFLKCTFILYMFQSKGRKLDLYHQWNNNFGYGFSRDNIFVLLKFSNYAAGNRDNVIISPCTAENYVETMSDIICYILINNFSLLIYYFP